MKPNQLLQLLTLILFFFSCNEAKKTSSLIPLSLVSILQIEKSEEQNRLNECTGRIPGKICITIVEHHPTNISQIELFQGGNLVSISDVSAVPITDAMCSIYYNIEWDSSSPYRSTKIYLKNTDGEFCGIGWEKKRVRPLTNF